MGIVDKILTNLPFVTYCKYINDGRYQDRELGVPYYQRAIKIVAHATYGIAFALWATGFLVTQEINPAKQLETVKILINPDYQEQKIKNSLELKLVDM
ncbi:hypothetical protein J4438_03390 [Candidatus Woesearchaeota archaeon]|nr:hypothetical protein [Candidatus Woesearchaeota archaeon]